MLRFKRLLFFWHLIFRLILGLPISSYTSGVRIIIPGSLLICNLEIPGILRVKTRDFRKKKIYFVQNLLNFSFQLSNKVEKCLCIRYVCPRSNSPKYSSNVLKLLCYVHIWHSMNRIENGICTTSGLSTDSHKSFPIHYDLWVGGNIYSAFYYI